MFLSSLYFIAPPCGHNVNAAIVDHFSPAIISDYCFYIYIYVIVLRLVFSDKNLGQID